MDWAPQQREALDAITSWLDDPNGDQVFYLAGYAGTGKSTLAKTIGEHERERVLPSGRSGYAQFAAFTGKAALVLKRKGCDNASTIHSLIYTTMDKSKDHLRELETLLNASPNDMTLIEAVADEKANLERPGWSLKSREDILNKWTEDPDTGRPYVYARISLFVVDEVSMVDKKLGEDLEDIGARILVLGDPAQLPPVMGAGYFTSRRPNYTLTEIHRQALDSPVLNLATLARQGSPMPLGNLGTSRVCLKTDLNTHDWLSADMVLVGKNQTRNLFNKRLRVLKGFEGYLPCPGERLVCLRNNHKAGLLNGGLWDVLEVNDDPKSDCFNLKAKSADDDRVFWGQVLKFHFMNTEKPTFFDRDTENEFTFGYCLTVHKAQGSEWPHVIYYDEWKGGFMERSRKEHVYTAITRASDRITVVQT